MLTISKLKHRSCVLAYIVPRLFRGNVRNIPSRLEKSSISVQRTANKSSDSGNKERDNERCQRIVDRALRQNSSHTNFNSDPVPKRSSLNLMTPDETGPDNHYEKCQKIIDRIFGEDTNAEFKKREIIDPVYIPVSELQATTANENEETLAQKVEVINETPLVEAYAKEKVEGFNVQPKVLGNINEQQTSATLQNLCCSCDKTKQGRGSGTCKQDDTFDELAKRCLDSPSRQIDQRILKEMEKLGVPPSTPRGSKRTAKDEGIVQPEIMRKPRRPVEKTELDYLSRMSRLRELKRLNDVLPPPFELVPMKTVSPVNSLNLFMSCDAEDNNDNNMYIERMQPYHVSNCLPKNVEECISPIVENKFEKLQQESLGQMTAVVMSDKTDEIEQSFVDNIYIERMQPYHVSNCLPKDVEECISPIVKNKDEKLQQELLGQMTALVKSDNTDEIEETFVHRQERLNHVHDKYLNRNDDGTNTSNDNADISLLKFKEKDIAVPREKIASTNFLSDFVDPNDISPQAKPTGFMKEYIEIETLQKILQTRSEHLADYIVKSHQFKENIINDSPVTESNADNQQEMELLLERFDPYHCKEDPNIMSKETSPYTEPGILIRDILENETANVINVENASVVNETTKIMGDKNASHKSYSLKQKSITPHQLFEQISLISREAELGTRDDYQELESRQLLENLEVVSNDPPLDKSLADKNTLNIMTKGTDGNQNIMNPYRDIHENNLKNKDSDAKLYKECTLLSSSELSRRSLTEEETDNPVIAVEMGRLDSPIDKEQLKNPYDVPFVSASNTEPFLRTTSISNKDVAQETFVNPLIDKGAVGDISAQNMNAESSSSSTIAKNHAQEPLALSEMLKRVRERSMMELYKRITELKFQNAQVDPTVGECESKNSCSPPACTPPKGTSCPPKDPCPPKQPPCPPKQPPCPPTQPPCPPKQPPCPPKEPPKEPCDPCKPKSPPACSPAKPRCPPKQPRYPRKKSRCPQKKPMCPPKQPPCNPCQTKCPPTKKSPCEKFRKTKCSTLKFQDVLTLLLYSGPQLLVHQKCMLPVLHSNIKNLKSEVVKQLCTKLQEQCNIVLMPGFSKKINALESVTGKYNTSINYARTYDPWCPIPSWKVPVKEEKKKFVCPNKGCPVIPPKKDACELSPCKNFPRHNKFKLLDFIISLLLMKNVKHD